MNLANRSEMETQLKHRTGLKQPLLPAGRTPAQLAAQSSRQSPDPILEPKKKRQRQKLHLTKVACSACRLRKGAVSFAPPICPLTHGWAANDIVTDDGAKCDGRRPTCSTCSQRSLECVYLTKDENETLKGALKRENEELKANSKKLKDLINLMNSRPDLPAKAILGKIGAPSNPHTQAALISLRTPSPQLQLSEQQSARGLFGDEPSPFEFELMVNHPMAYPSFDLSDRLGLPSHPLSGLYSIANSDVGAGIPAIPVDVAKTAQSSGVSLQDIEIDQSEGAFSARTLNASMPLRTGCFDPLFATLSIRFWTMVPIQDFDAVNIISQFFERHLPFWSVLDPHLFLNSLVAKRLDFCSSFLVNSLLALSSVGLPFICFMVIVLISEIAIIHSSKSVPRYTMPII